MASGIKIIDYFGPIKTRVPSLNPLVLSHSRYAAFSLGGIPGIPLKTLEKRLNWGVKACSNRSKYDRSSYLKLNYKILPVRYFLDVNAINYYWKIKNLKIPLFKGEIVFPTAKIQKKS